MAQIGAPVPPSRGESVAVLARARPAPDADRAVLRGIAQIFQAALASDTEEDLGRQMLELAQTGTSSPTGFIGEIDANGRFEHVAMSSPVWSACRVAGGKDGAARQSRLSELCCTVLTEARTVTDNAAGTGGSSDGDGPGPFLGTPLLQNGSAIGLVAVADKPGGYDPQDAETLEALAPAIVAAYGNRRWREQLRESQAKFKGFYDNAPLLMGLCEMDGDEVLPIDINPAALQFFGPPSERRGPDGNARLWLESYRQCRDTGEPVQFELEHKGPGGRRWLAATITNLGPSRNGRLLFGFVAEDVTFRRLRDDARDAFTGVLAHELRTPMTSILAGSELLAGGRLAGDDAAGVARDVADEARRLARLVENLLVVSRVERRISLERHEPVSVRHLIAQETADARRNWPTHRFTASVARDLPVAAGDDGYVTQVLRNLVSNAATFGRGSVAISAAPIDGGVQVAVADDGPGLEPGSEERVFDLFYRGRVPFRVGSGAGMGLFVSRALAEAMGGRIHAGRSASGGAEFDLWLQTYR